jgi:hypothetical protein
MPMKLPVAFDVELIGESLTPTIELMFPSDKSCEICLTRRTVQSCRNFALVWPK